MGYTVSHRNPWLFLWQSRDIRQRILVTVGLIVIYRLLQNIPLPGINPDVIKATIPSGTSLHTIAGFISMLSGGSLLGFSILALGLFPYNLASQVLSLLIPLIPRLDRRFQENLRHESRKLFEKWCYFLSVPIAIFSSYNLIIYLDGDGTLFTSGDRGMFLNFLVILTAVVALTAGSFVAVFIAETISEHGIRAQGNAILIVSGIIGEFTKEISSVLSGLAMTERIVYVLLFFLCIVAVVLLQQARRNVPIIFPQKSQEFYAVQRSRNIKTPQSVLPLMVSIGTGGLIGSQLLILIVGICAFLLSYTGIPSLNSISFWIINIFDPNSLLFGPIIFCSVVAYTYLYSDVEFAQQNYGHNLKAIHAIIPGVQEGDATERYLRRINRRITFAPALVLGILAIVPWVFNYTFGTDLSVLDGEKIILIVGITHAVFMNIEAELKMHGYQ